MARYVKTVSDEIKRLSTIAKDKGPFSPQSLEESLNPEITEGKHIDQILEILSSKGLIDLEAVDEVIESKEDDEPSLFGEESEEKEELSRVADEILKGFISKAEQVLEGQINPEDIDQWRKLRK